MQDCRTLLRQGNHLYSQPYKAFQRRSAWQPDKQGGPTSWCRRLSSVNCLPCRLFPCIRNNDGRASRLPLLRGRHVSPILSGCRLYPFTFFSMGPPLFRTPALRREYQRVQKAVTHNTSTLILPVCKMHRNCYICSV